MLRRYAVSSMSPVIVLLVCSGFASGDSPAAWWKFDEGSGNVAMDCIGQIEDKIEGEFKYVAGVSGKAIRFDGYTTVIVREAGDAPQPGDEFTIEAWVAQGAYPWNWCPIATQKSEQAGYYFAVGPRGDFKVRAYINDEWQECISESFVIGLRQWAHIAGSYNKSEGLTLYLNGKEAGKLSVTGPIQYARDAELRIGMNYEKLKPSNIHREHGTLPGWFSFDGIMDEVKIYNRALSKEEMEAVYAVVKPQAEPELPVRIMPSGPKGSAPFGAYYCKLKYYDEWDNLWAVGPDPDVVVRFDTSGVRMVFWRGSRYSAAWVSETGLWMADQSVEAWNDEEGCFEHMQDYQCRYSHVRVIESHPGRVVVHWRYAPVSAHDHLWRVNEKTQRACWVDEYYYIYPDQMAIRNPTWKTGTLGDPRQFQESLPFTDPGQLIGEVINEDWAFVGNMKGESATLRFTENPKKEKEGLPEDLTIQIYNFKSENKPFIIFEPGNQMDYLNDRLLGPQGLNIPGSCNHWPVGQAMCDGRAAQAADRPTHFLGFPISSPPIHEKDGRSWWNGLYGMSGKTIEELAFVGRSWAYASKLTVKGSGLDGDGYDMAQRAYKLTSEGSTSAELTLAASEESPVFNPVFIVENWGRDDVTLRIDGKKGQNGRDFRYGHRHRLEGSDLIVWVAKSSIKPVSISLVPVKKVNVIRP